MGQDVLGGLAFPLMADHRKGGTLAFGGRKGQFTGLSGVIGHQRQAERAVPGLVGGVANGGGGLPGGGIMAQGGVEIGAERIRRVQRSGGQPLHHGKGDLKRESKQQQAHDSKRAAPDRLQSPSPGELCISHV